MAAPTNGNTKKAKRPMGERLTLAKVMLKIEENTALTKRTIRDLSKRVDKLAAQADEGFGADDDVSPSELCRRMDTVEKEMQDLENKLDKQAEGIQHHGRQINTVNTKVNELDNSVTEQTIRIAGGMIDPAVNLAELANLVDTGIKVTLTIGETVVVLEKGEGDSDA